MKKTYYLFNPGRLARKDNTLQFTAVDENGRAKKPKYIPVSNVEDLYIFGSLDTNSAMFNFLGKQGISAHYFDYYENYTGSFVPKDQLLAGKLRVKQSEAYLKPKKRLPLAQAFVQGGGQHMLRTLSYYQRKGKKLETQYEAIAHYMERLSSAEDVPMLMGIEGNIRQVYYSAFDMILNDFVMEGRSSRPPKNEVNALISFGNMLCYTVCMNQLYHTQLDPTISYLHEPGTRRYSLALDLAEIFKPILVDRMIFRLLNRRQLQGKHFRTEVNRAILTDLGRKIFLRAWDEGLTQSIQHKGLGRKVSYKHLIRLECYKLVNHLLGIEKYEPFRLSY